MWQAPENDQIRDRSSDRANQRIDDDTRQELAKAESPTTVHQRLAELDREWDIDRALMLNFAVIGGGMAALALRSMRRHRKLGVPGVLLFTQLGFLAYHAIRRWCPPMPVFRRLGFRSDREIAAERVELESRLHATWNR